jgi:hypothetical protein
MSEKIQAVVEEITKAANDQQFRRLHHFASGERGGSVMLDVSRDTRYRGNVIINWNVNRGSGYRAKGWHKSFGGPNAESEALAFVPAKWEQLVTWLEALEPKQSAGAAGAFSAQVASMQGGL